MDPRPPSDPRDSHEDETRRKAASIWFERFERKRQSKLSPRRQSLVRWALIGAAFGMLLLGVQLRSDRMERVLGDKEGDAAGPRSPAEWSALLSRELQLDGGSGATFFPLWESWLRDEDARRIEREDLVGRLDELSGERSDVNSEVARLADRLQALDSASVAERGRLLREVRERLGPWRSARLQTLVEEVVPVR